ncbi:unnamed protein product [Bursaphelenchus okinawaensis]|uniref:Uncharacterized protein n=1 Tax=Bursaphelenchus okinawaensis TaxID=465554 RepID=A0A811JUR0_9BILA|nr:unnamed protein product [Bursaphelenchus okinawaensis]CAG9084007.1 unnamed protein product [Bursaphelenchus okinawaensis]
MSECSEVDCETSTSMTESFLFNRYSRNDEDNDETTEYIPKGQLTFSEWEKFEKKRLEMLTEAKDRAECMENTMKWWAECTAMWREKWSIVRNERNQARLTIEKLIKTLHEIQEDTLKYFDAKEEAEKEVRRLREEVTDLKNQLLRS